MAARQWVQADSIRFSVTGRGAQGLFARAAAQGVRLWSVSCAGQGYLACAAGRDWARLEAIAAGCGWQLALVRRRGPGRLLERLRRRPGIPAGLGAFLLLWAWLPGFVWQIDFGTLPADVRPAVRGLLDQSGIREGSWLRRTELDRAQQALDLQMEQFGWVSLHFGGGCLAIEYTEREIQTVQEDPQPAALYARAAGQVTAIELTGGFPAVTAGQYVAAGELLANGQKADRTGNPVTQPAAGRILAAVQRSYTAEQPLVQTVTMLTGRACARTTLYLPGYAFRQPDEAADAGAGLVRKAWQPLRLGRIALPGCVYTETVWEQADRTLRLTEASAQALAQRACRLQLLAEFPDAEIEAQTPNFSETPDGAVQCTVLYRFTADIAQPGPVAPIETENGF